MKRDYLRSALALVVGLVLSLTNLDAQTFDLGFATNSIGDATTSCQYCATVQIKSAGSPFNLGGLSFVFSYNEDAMTFGTYTSINFDENTNCDGQGNLFNPQAPFVANGQVSSGVAPTIFTGFASCPEVGTEFVDIAEICFDVVDETAMGNLVWSDNSSQFPATTSQDLLTELTVGLLTNVEEVVVCQAGGGGGGGAEDTDTDTATDGGADDGATDDGGGADDGTAGGDGTDGGDGCDIVVTEVGFDCDEDAGEFTYTISITGGAPSADPTETYSLTGTGIGNALPVFADAVTTLGPYSDGTDVSISIVDVNGCPASFTTDGPVACTKECGDDIVVTEIFDCNEDDAEFTYTFVITGGAPGSDPLESYTVNGTGVNNAMVASGGNLTVVYSDGTDVELTFTDSGGCETTFSSGGPVACTKEDCDDPVVITEVFECDEDAGIFTYTFIITGGAPSADPTEFYTVTGTNIGAPLMAFAGSPVVLSFADGTAVALSVVDSNNCPAEFSSDGPIPCSKETDTDSDTDGADDDGATDDGATDDGGDDDGATDDGATDDGATDDGGDDDGTGGDGCVVPTPAAITYQSGGTSANICIGDGQQLDVVVASAPTGEDGFFIITDGSGSVILDGPAAPPFNFDNTPVGTCQIWHVTFDGDLNIPSTSMVSDFDGCYSISNPLTIIRDGAPSAPQIFETALGGTLVGVCNNDGFVNNVNIGTVVAGSGVVTEYLLTDAAGNIISGPVASSNFSFLGLAGGTYNLWAITYSGPISVGSTAASISGCFALSNPVEVQVTANCQGGMPMNCIGVNAAFVTLSGLACENTLINAAATITSSNPNDVVIYVLADQAGNNLISSSSGVFAPSQIPGFLPDAFYFVTVQGGPDLNGDSFPDVNDQCFTSVQGPALVWSTCIETQCPTVTTGTGLSAVCSGGSANVTATISGQGTFAVAYVLHTNQAFSPSQVVATSFNGVFTNPGGAANVTYFSSVLVGTDLNGDGVPDANSECFGVFPAQQVAFLAPLSIVAAAEFCNDETGITTVTWVVTGGLPQFNPNATYSVSGSVNLNVGHNQQFQSEFSDGESYALTAVDGFCGQTQSISDGPLTCKDLPIELLVFDGEVQGKGNLLFWVTATEIDNDFFTLERSFDGATFEEIAIIDGAGNSLDNIEYEFLDEDARPGSNFYRLRQTDFNNTNTVTDAIELFREFGNNITTISPVPATNFITVSYEAAKEVEVIMSVYDIIGRQVMAREIDMEEGINNIDLGLDTIPSGVYLLSIEADGDITTKKFIKN